MSRGSHQRGDEKTKMSYEAMEAMLVDGIFEIRTSEAAVLKSLGSHESDAARELQRLQAKLENLEQLLSAMERAPQNLAVRNFAFS